MDFAEVDALARVLCARDVFSPLHNGDPCAACTSKAVAAIQAGWHRDTGQEPYVPVEGSQSQEEGSGHG